MTYDNARFLGVTANWYENLNLPSEIMGLAPLFDDPWGKVGKLRQSLKLNETQSIERASAIPKYSYDPLGMAVGYGIVIIPVLLCGFILIYNCFALSIKKDIREYELLRIVGADSKQIWAMSLREGIILLTYGAGVGFIVSVPLSIIIIPEILQSVTEFNWQIKVPFMLVSYFMTFSFALAVVVLGCRKAVVKSQGISAIEAIKYVDISTKEQKNGTGTICSMATSNVQHGLKMALPLVCMICAGAIAYLCVGVMTSSMNLVAFADMYTKGHSFVISNLEGDKNKDENLYRVKSELDQIEGMEAVSTLMRAEVTVDYEPETLKKYMQVSGNVIPKDGKLGGYLWGIDSRELFRGNTLALCPEIYIYTKAMAELGIGNIEKIYLDIDEKYTDGTTREEIEALFKQNPVLDIKDNMALQEEALKACKNINTVGGIFCVIFIAMGIMGFANMQIINRNLREVEFISLWRIGMTRGQLKHIIFIESIYYAIASTIVMIVAGNGLIFGFYKLFSIEAEYTTFLYPFKEFSVCILVVFMAIVGIYNGLGSSKAFK